MDPATAKMAVQVSTALARHRGLRYLLVAVVLLAMLTGSAVAFGPWMLATQLASTLRAQQQATTDGGSCGASAEVIDTKAASAGSLSSDQIGHARLFWELAQKDSRLGDRAAVVGIEMALQESELRNLSYGDSD